MDSNVSYLESTNIAFMGCNVVEGEGRGIVVATGNNNQVSECIKFLKKSFNFCIF